MAFKQLRDLEPENYVAQALITKLSVDVAEDGDFPKELARLQKLTPRSDTEQLMRAVTEHYVDPLHALELIDSPQLTSRSVVKLMVRANAKITLALITASLDLCEEGLRDEDALQLIIGPNPNIRSSRLLGLSYAMYLKRQRGDEGSADRYRELAEIEYTHILKEYPDDLVTQVPRWYFLNCKSDLQVAWETLKLFSGRGSNSIFAALDRLRNQPDAQLALQEFDNAVGNVATNDYTKLARAFLLTRLPNRAHEIASVANELSQHRTVMLQHGALHLYCMLGDALQARKIANRILNERSNEDFISLWNERGCIQAYANPDYLPTLLTSSESDPFKQAKARYTAAMIRLSEGNLDAAKEELEKVAKAQVWTFPEDAEALLAWMTRDKQWPYCQATTK